MKPPSEKWNSDSHGVWLVEHDHDANLTRLRYADDFLLISGSRKDHPARRPHHGHNSTWPTTTHRENINHLQNDIEIQAKNIITVQGMNMEILPAEGDTKYLGQLVSFKSAVQVEFDHHFKCAWAVFTSHRQELTSPRCPLKERYECEQVICMALIVESRQFGGGSSLGLMTLLYRRNKCVLTSLECLSTCDVVGCGCPRGR